MAGSLVAAARRIRLRSHNSAMTAMLAAATTPASRAHRHKPRVRRLLSALGLIAVVPVCPGLPPSSGPSPFARLYSVGQVKAIRAKIAVTLRFKLRKGDQF